MSSDLKPVTESWPSAPESAPSQMSKDEPTFARAIGMLGLMLVSIGAAAALVASFGRTSMLLGPTAGGFLMIVGIAFLLFHAVRDADVQIRRSYSIIGYLWLFAAILTSFLPYPAKGPPGAGFLPFGVPSLGLALLFLLSSLRHETEKNWLRAGKMVLSQTAIVLAGVGFIGGSMTTGFLLPYGLVLALFGLAYGWAYVGLEGSDSTAGYRFALILGIMGFAALVVAIVHSLLPQMARYFGWSGLRLDPYFVPSGLVLSLLAFLYVSLAAGLVSDNLLMVLTRRELAAFFYSPIAYVILLSMIVMGWVMFVQFIVPLRHSSIEQTQPFPEPIVMHYFFGLWSVLPTILVVPILTMRLLSEEHRAGTLEVLLTAPVRETTVVASKFLAVFVFFMLSVLTWGLYLIALRIEGGQPFEYRPIIGFYLALACSGAGFLAMGLFFSSLTRNQIASALLTAMGMILLTAVFWVHLQTDPKDRDGLVASILGQASYLGLWRISTEGMLAPPYMIFHLSAAVFWLFLTVKVLESRKWR